MNKGMTEEEKKAIANLIDSSNLSLIGDGTCIISNETIAIVLNLIEKQQKEIKEYTKFKKAIVNRIMIWDKKELPDNEIIISVLDTFVAEISRLEDIEDRKIQVKVKFIEEKRDKYWEKKIKEKIQYIQDNYSEHSEFLIGKSIVFLQELLREDND